MSDDFDGGIVDLNKSPPWSPEEQAAIDYYWSTGRLRSIKDLELFTGPVLEGVTIGPDGEVPEEEIRRVLGPKNP